MDVLTRRSGARAFVRGVLLGLLPAAMTAQNSPSLQDTPPLQDPRLPNGKNQRDEILRAEYDQNLKDARELSAMARSFELDLEKSDRFVLSLPLLRRLDDMEKLTRRIRSRMRR